ncbi:S-layer homology domain-containing protein [Paenibacillus filicis]|uniref:S-layer homology domain-containing protein n=1 Tax=Paenibacillus filicis TaxID=669464 RepID=A0ABU9DN46_9BACL
MNEQQTKIKKWINYQRFASGLMLLALAAILIAPADARADSFTDLTGHWAGSVVETAIAQHFIQGYEDGTFRPDHEVTRAEAAGMLSRVTRLKGPDKASDPFPGLDKHWSRNEVSKLAGLGFISSADYPQGFQPDAPVSRFEIMKWMATGLAQADTGFRQALQDTVHTLLPTPEIYKGGVEPEQIPYLAVAKGAGLIDGFDDGSFRPNGTATRAELAAILLRYARVEGSRAEDYQALNELREVGLTGTNAISLTPYRYLKKSTTDEQGVYLPEYIKMMGIGLTRKSDFDSLKPYLDNPDTGIYFYSDDHPEQPRFVPLKDLKTTIKEAVLEGEQQRESMYLGPGHPKDMSIEDVKLYFQHRYIHLKVDDELVPYTSFANITDRPITAGDLAVLTLHRMIFVEVPAGESPKGVYASFFMDGGEPWMNGHTEGIYLIFKETTMKVLDKTMDLMEFYNAPGRARGNGLLFLNRIPLDIAAKKGFTTIPDSHRSFFVQGSENRFWSYNSFPMTDNRSLIITTDSGDRVWMSK